MSRAFRSLRNHDGSAVIEFAITFPILLVIIFGCVDVAQFFIQIDKVRRAAATASDIGSQWWSVPTPADGGPPNGQGPLGPKGMTTILKNAAQVALPAVPGTGTGAFSLAMTFVQGVKSGAKVKAVIEGQVVYPPNSGGPSLLTGTAAGPQNKGKSATLPAGLIIHANDQMIFTEVFYTFNPFPFSVGNQQVALPGGSTLSLHDYAVYRPRQFITFNSSD